MRMGKYNKSKYTAEKEQLELDKLRAEIESLKHFNKTWIKLLPSLIQLSSVIVGALILWYTGVFEREVKLQKLENQEAQREKRDLEKGVVNLKQKIYNLYYDSRTISNKLNVAKDSLKRVQNLYNGVNFKYGQLISKYNYSTNLLNTVNNSYFEEVVNQYFNSQIDYDTLKLAYLKKNYLSYKDIIQDKILKQMNQKSYDSLNQIEKELRALALEYYLTGNKRKADLFLINLKNFVLQHEKNVKFYDYTLRAFYNTAIWSSSEVDSNMALTLKLSSENYHLKPQVMWHAAFLVFRTHNSKGKFEYNYLPEVYRWFRSELKFLIDTTTNPSTSVIQNKSQTTYNLIALFEICPPCFFSYNSKVIHDNIDYLDYYSAIEDSIRICLTVKLDSNNTAVLQKMDERFMAPLRIEVIKEANFTLINNNYYNKTYLKYANMYHYPILTDPKYDNLDYGYFIYMEDIVDYYNNEDPNVRNYWLYDFRYTNKNKFEILEKFANYNYSVR